MDTITVSDNFRSLLGDNRQVEAAVFTTYNFEPDFFEQEVVPLMLDQDVAFSADGRVKSIQVREALNEVALPIEVFYDRDMFRTQGSITPSMEYLHHGIRGAHGAFHAKLCFLLLREEESEEQVLMVGAGSANLTRAGWWENVEAQHWEEVRSGAAQRRFINRLQEDVDWLLDQRRPMGDEASSALSLVSEFLTECRGRKGADYVGYYGLGGVFLGQANRPAFMRFLQLAQGEQCGDYRRWNMDIISPYFAVGSEFDGHEWFFQDLGVEEIRVFLPMNEHGEALCDRDYYEYIEQAEGIQWANWSDELIKELRISRNANRFTHAKLYHLYNGKQSWVFVGSVNFTPSATRFNQEAGFFVKVNHKKSLLKPLETAPDNFCPPEKGPGKNSEQEQTPTLPDIKLVYDWKARQLIGSVSEGQVVIDLLTPEHKLAVWDMKLDEGPDFLNCKPEILESLLRNSGFINVTGRSNKSKMEIPEHFVVVQQLNWTHKPLDLPHLTPQEIVQIYAGLNPARRNQLIEHLKERQLRESNLLGESTSSTEYENLGREFFCEYAELFHAFRNLKARMKRALEEGRENQVDYYLSGRGLDSLPTLFESLFDEDRQLDAVTVYLTLLCLVELYEDEAFSGRAQVSSWLEKCQTRLDEMEQGKELNLINSNPERQKQFFQWYRGEFFRQYWQQESEAPDEAH